MKEEEVVKKITEWKDEIKDLAVGYSNAIGELDKIREDYQKSTFEKFCKLIPLIIALVPLIIVILVIKYPESINSIEAAGFKLSTRNEEKESYSQGSPKKRQPQTLYQGTRGATGE